MGTLILTFDLERKQMISSNDRLHFAVKAKKTAFLRKLALISGRSIGERKTMQKYCVIWTIQSPTKRKFDADNYAPTTKALRDGLVDAGIISDDNNDNCLMTSYKGEVREEKGKTYLISCEIVEQNML